MNREQVGKRLKKLRGKRRIDEVANALGITKQAVYFYETGRRMPKDNMKSAIAEYYGKSVQDIFFAE